jgi:fumarylacetoacetase
VVSSNGHPDFPIQNLPFGVFTPPGGGAPRAGGAIGDMILDLAAVLDAGLFSGEAACAVEATSGGILNALFALGAGPRRALRARLSELLAEGSAEQARLAGLLHPAAQCRLHLPAHIGDYTDFYVGIHHATNVGTLFRPDNPLLPNYKYVPIGYHGRASSVVPSGTPIHRPNGQRKLPTETTPSFGPCRNLDYELELGVWIGPGNTLGTPIPVGKAAEHVAGYCLLNDWSARDMQAWEYQPLGPFLAKNFATTVSPWVVTLDALEPFRVPAAARPAGDPTPLPYLSAPDDQARGAFDLTVEVWLTSARMRTEGVAPMRLSRGRVADLYWTPAQMLAHHTSNGCNLHPGDLFASGTVSGPEKENRGCLLELTWRGAEPLPLPTGETRTFLEDGDEVVMRGYAEREGAARIGFGECRGMVG